MYIVCVGIVRPHDNKHVLELRPDSFWRERFGAFLLEDNGDDVVADVTFTQKLLSVGRREGEHGGHVEHHLVIVKGGVQ